MGVKRNYDWFRPLHPVKTPLSSKSLVMSIPRTPVHHEVHGKFIYERDFCDEHDQLVWIVFQPAVMTFQAP